MSITIIGDAFVDVIYPLLSSKPGETHFEKINMKVGGHVFIAIQISRIGERVKFLGKLGRDPFGDYLRNHLLKNNVQNYTSIDEHMMTGICLSMTYENGERTMIADRGANDNLLKEDINQFFDEIAKSKIIYFSGYSLLNKNVGDIILETIYRIKSADDRVKIVFNPGAPNIAKPYMQQIIKKYVDILILNYDEAVVLTGYKDQNQIIVELCNINNNIVVTKGDFGCILISDGNRDDISTEKIQVKDTTGAGDAFSAGFIASYSRGMKLVDCGIFGNKVALDYLKSKVTVH